MTVTVVWAREPIPSGPSVFLAGPTPRRGDGVESWRPAAVEALAEQWTGPEPLTVLTPESRGGKRAAHYDDQVGWETEARAQASAVLFWIPRDLAVLPGFTTNVEFGLDAPTGRAVLGCPADCPNPERNRYLIYVARRLGVPVRETLTATATAALSIVTERTSISGELTPSTVEPVTDRSGNVDAVDHQER
ncbi:nucleoside 2-deoxyribosyltransferase domain-containing protein [Streptomyces sp. NPDC090442]|uniref:nucleoside 2-deoxyribosyltransferase domain-containing protein n=1 Tax=Streptomyces sp. NPDC090442 TaxID=3365962 RepID=UPI003817E7A6